MHIGMQSYAAAAHLAARVYNEQQVRCIFSFSLRSRTNCSLLEVFKKSLCRTISFEEECRRTAQQRGRISLLFLPEKRFLQLVRVRRERDSTLQAAQIPVCVAAAVPLRASALIKRASS